MGHENDCRNLLDQRSVDGVNIWQLLFGLLSWKPAGLRFKLVGTAEKYRGKDWREEFLPAGA
jgi:hypothetical protein